MSAPDELFRAELITRISVATIISFAARGLSVTGYFCYGAVASAGVCLILPGYVICGFIHHRILDLRRNIDPTCSHAVCGALELASKNIVAGSVRMVYAIIYSLFLVSYLIVVKHYHTHRLS